MGYASDPELEVRKVKQSSNTVDEPTDQDGGTVIQTRRRHRVDFRSNDPTSVAKTANWQDLFKFVVDCWISEFCLQSVQACYFAIMYTRQRHFAA
jgi:hypothetical protein